MKSVTVDFLIIGSGISGLYLAKKLASIGKVLIVTKSEIKESCSYYAQGGIAAVIDPLDSEKKHREDTLKAGAYHNNVEAVEYLVKHGKSALTELITLSVNFDNAPSCEGGHSFSRIHHTQDQTGKSIIEALLRSVKSDKNIEIWKNTPALDLLLTKKNCDGMRVLKHGKECVYVYSQKVILASGGYSQIYKKSSNPQTSTGDGLAIALRAGVECADLEFIQFHPTGFQTQDASHFLLSETLRGEGAYLINYKGMRFMDKYDKRKELAPRDIVSQAIYREQATGSVYLDFRHKTKSFLEKRFPHIYTTLKTNGYSLESDIIPITPVAHYTCGGVKVNISGKTSLKHLYAIGEVACTGVHGANRLASNSLLEGIVFAHSAYEDIQKNIIPGNCELKTYYSIDIKHETPYMPKSKELQEKIRHIMWEYVGIYRTQNSLSKAHNELENIENPSDYQTQNMLIVAKNVTKAALARKEKLGCHWIA